MSTINKTDVPTHDKFKVLKVTRDEVREILDCLFHSILFVRALGTHEPMEVSLGHINIEFSKCNNRDLDKIVEDNIQTILSGLKEETGELKVVLTFYSNIENKSPIWNTQKKQPWEHWIIQLEIVKSLTANVNSAHQCKTDKDSSYQKHVVQTVLQQNLAYSGSALPILASLKLAQQGIKKNEEENINEKNSLEESEQKRIASLETNLRENLAYIIENALPDSKKDYIPKPKKAEICFPFEIRRILDTAPSLLKTFSDTVATLLSSAPKFN